LKRNLEPDAPTVKFLGANPLLGQTVAKAWERAIKKSVKDDNFSLYNSLSGEQKPRRRKAAKKAKRR